MPVMFVDPQHHVARGGNGGAPFNSTAPNPAQALVGLRVWTGAVVDAVAPIFAELFADGTVGPIVIGPKSGGSGGRAVDLTISNAVVVGIRVKWGAVVDEVCLAFRGWTTTGVAGPETYLSPVGGTGGDHGPEQDLFPLGRCAIAVHGRAGPDHFLGRLDSIGLVSALPV